MLCCLFVVLFVLVFFVLVWVMEFNCVCFDFVVFCGVVVNVLVLFWWVDGNVVLVL